MNRRKLADMRLTGTQEEISYTLAVLMFRGCLWATDKEYHPLEEQGQFAYFLEEVSAPLDIPDRYSAKLQDLLNQFEGGNND